MEFIKELLSLQEEEVLVQFRYNVVLRAEAGGFGLTLDTNVTASSKEHAIQLVKRHLERRKGEINDVMTLGWKVSTVQLLKKDK